MQYWTDEVAAETEHYEVRLEVDDWAQKPDWDFTFNIACPEPSYYGRNYLDRKHLADSKDWEGRNAYYRVHVDYNGYEWQVHGRITPGFMSDEQWQEYDLVFWTSRKRATELLGTNASPDTIFNCLEQEAKTMCAYWNGHVYEWVVKDKETGEPMESCSGYYGEDEFPYMVEEALNAATYLEEQLILKAQAEVETWKDVPLELIPTG
jgi:hypothetical protein